MTSSIRDRVQKFDFDNASPYDLAVLLEQVFLYQGRPGESCLVMAQEIIGEYEKSVRQRTLPELHSKTHCRLRELRSTLVQLETSLSGLERDASLRSPSR